MAADPSSPDSAPNDPTDTAVAEPPVAPAKPARKARPRSSRPESKKLPPFKVLLHNDDVNDMPHVVMTICKLTTLSSHDAVRKMWEAHTAGVALLLMTHRERAELYVEQFASCKLTVTAEPDA